MRRVRRKAREQLCAYTAEQASWMILAGLEAQRRTTRRLNKTPNEAERRAEVCRGESAQATGWGGLSPVHYLVQKDFRRTK